MRFFKSISFRIWMIFALMVMSVLTFFIIYYPMKQRELLTDYKKTELEETAETVATSVILALKNDDYDGVKIAINQASEKKDFEFLAVLLEEQNNKAVLASYPEVEEEKILNRTNEELLYELAPFQYGEFKGEVVVALSKTKINTTISALTQPIYITAVIVLVVSIILFYFIAAFISKPIVLLTRVTNTLKMENFEMPLSFVSSDNELGELHNSIAALQTNLLASRKRNRELTDNLEQQVIARTAELKATAEKLLEAQETARIGNFEYNIELNQWNASPISYSILQMPEQPNYPIEKFWELLKEEDAVEALAFFETFKPNVDTLFEKDFKIFLPGNSTPLWIHFTYKVLFNEKNEPRFIKGTIQDITYRKKIEEELNELSLVAKKTSNYVIITDKEKRIKWVNDSLLKVSGYSMEELIGQKPTIFQFEKSNPETLHEIRQKLAEGQEVKTEILNRGKNGNEYWLELNIVPIKNPRGETQGFIAVETDITDIKASEESIRKLNENLEIRVLENTRKNLELSGKIVEQEKLATLGELAAGVAHDLNTPLGSTKVGAESLQFALQEIMRILPMMNNAEQSAAVSIADKIKTNLAVSGLQKKKEEAAMLHFLEEALNYQKENAALLASRLTESRIKPENQAEIERIIQSRDPLLFLDLIYNLQLKNVLLESILVSTDNAAKVVRNIRSFINKGEETGRSVILIEENIRVVLNVFQHEIKKDVELEMNIEKGLSVSGFDIKLFQLWSNLIKNSLDAMDGQKDKKIWIAGTKTGKGVLIEFSNNGPQIPQEYLDKIFRKFFTTKSNKKGTGLGLSIVKNVLEAHHAKIEVSSDASITRFSMLFPLANS